MKINKIKRVILSLGLFLSVLATNFTNIEAASFSVSASASSVSPGGSFKVTVSVAGEGKFNFSASNGSVSTSTSWVTGSYSFSVKAGSSGTTTVSVAAADVAANDGVTVISGTKSVSVSIKGSSGGNSGGSGGSSGGSSNGGTRAPTETKSNINLLSALTVNKGTLSPAFAEGTASYTVTLDAAQKDIEIGAKAKDSKAKVSGTGVKTLNPGDNKIDVVCTAEDGSTKTYSITVNVDETPTVFLEHAKQKLGFVKNISVVTAPNDTFAATTMKIDSEDVPVWKSEKQGLTLAYLVDDAGNKAFYIIEEGKISNKYETVSILGKSYVLMIAPKDMKIESNLKASKVKIGEVELDGWNFEDKSMKNYSLVYLLNDEGKKSLYSYETTEGTLQKYTSSGQSNDMTLTYVFIGTTAAFAVGCGVLAYMYFSFKKKSISAIKDYYDRKNDSLM